MRTPSLPSPQLALLLTGLALVGSFAPAHAQPVQPPRTPAPAQPAQPPRTQAPETKAAPTEDETVTIVGRVTMADSGAPVRRARVSVEIPGAGMGGAMTDAQGRYILKDLPRGRYRVSASKAPFVTMKHGQRYPNGPDTEVDLTSASSASRVDIALWRGGVIAGRLYDDLGEPAAYTQVVALRVRVRGGQRTFVPTGRAGTADDLGQYRLAGLPTGSYIVATVPARDGYRLAPSYFPGTKDAASATRVPVTAGSERSGVDFELGFAPTARVRGSVLGDAGRPIAATLLLSNGFDTTTTGTRPDGSFEFTNVSPGSYGLSAILQADPGSRRMTYVPLMVDGDLDGVVLRLDRGVTLRGVVSTDEGVPPAFGADQMALELSPIPGTAYSHGASRLVLVNADWTFVAANVGGVLRVRPRVLPDGWMIDRVLAGSEDVTDSGVPLATAENSGDVRVVLTNRATEVSGSVFDDQNAPVTGFIVVMFSENAANWGPTSRFVAAAAPDKSGRFRVPNLPPGTYRAVALEFLEEGAEEDPEVLASLRERALKFDLGKGESLKLSLPLTRVK